MFGRIGPTELVLILVIALIIFGPAKLPEIGRAIGKGLREFKSAAKDITSSTQDNDSEEEPKSRS